MSSFRKLGVDLCQALGIDPGEVSHLTIDVSASDLPVVVVTVPLLDEKADAVVDVVRRYRVELHREDDEEAA